jgi:predicted phosphodiesterase
MRIGIIGDIHGNIDALTAVLLALDRLNVSSILCTGDIVGYGACPKECIDLIRELAIPSVKGNHDTYTTEKDGHWIIRPEAREVILWNQKHLPADHIEWLRKLPRRLEFDGIAVVHASNVWHPEWPYVINERTAVHNFLFQRNQVCFNGHTHVPVCVLHQPGRRVELDRLRNMFLPRRSRVLIGVGAVGQPRDEDPRAAAVVYNTQDRSVRLLRVPYDVEAAQSRIIKAGLPRKLADRLAIGQ